MFKFMAISSNPLIGRASGKLSNFEFLTIKSQNVIRSSKLKRYKPFASSVISNQVKLRLFCQGLSSIKTIIKKSFIPKKKTWNPLNSFVSYNYNFFSVIDDRVLSLDFPENLVIANSHDFINSVPYDIDLSIRTANFYMQIPSGVDLSTLGCLIVFIYNGMMFTAYADGNIYIDSVLYFESDNIIGSIPARITDSYALFYKGSDIEHIESYYHSIYLGRYEL